MITVEQYFSKPYSVAQEMSADDLLRRVNRLIDEAIQCRRFHFQVDPDTRCEISGSKGGDGDGGFRTLGSRTGSPGSSHRQAQAVDVYDPQNELDGWLDDFEAPGDTGENSKLAEYELYREAPSATPGWAHLSTRAPGSGRRTFYP